MDRGDFAEQTRWRFSAYGVVRLTEPRVLRLGGPPGAKLEKIGAGFYEDCRSAWRCESIFLSPDLHLNHPHDEHPNHTTI